MNSAVVIAERTKGKTLVDNDEHGIVTKDIKGMLESVKMPPEKYCTACFSGDYPMDVTEPVEKFAMERGQLRMFT